MRCRKVVDLLPLLAGGDLQPERAAEVREHLARCFACTRAFAGQVAAQEALASVAWHHHAETATDTTTFATDTTAGTIGGVGPEFFDRMREEILAEVATDPVPAVGAHPWLRRRRFWFGGGFAAASILFVLGFVLGRGLPGNDGESAPRNGAARPHGPALPYQSAEPVSNTGQGAGSGHDSQPLGAFVSTRDIFGEFPLCGEDPEPLPEEADARRKAASRPGSAPAPLRGEPRGEEPRGERR
jgi:hypothetical protein